MAIELFVSLFPEQGVAETRSFTAINSPVPPDEYGILEAYCTDPACDCRRVMLQVIGRHQGRLPLAVVGYGFDRDDEFAGPYLDPLNNQSAYAEELLECVREVLADPAYVARLEAHYQQVKASRRERRWQPRPGPAEPRPATPGLSRPPGARRLSRAERRRR